jgi:hypothetical protein
MVPTAKESETSVENSVIVHPPHPVKIETGTVDVSESKETKTLGDAKAVACLPNRWGIKRWWWGETVEGGPVRVNDSRGSPGHVLVCVSFPEDAFMVLSSSNPSAQLQNLRREANPRAQLRWTSALCTDQQAAETIVHNLLKSYRFEPALPWYRLDIDAMMSTSTPKILSTNLPSDASSNVAARPCLEMLDAINRIASAIAHLNVGEGAVAAKHHDIRPRSADYE